jgi:hypothetical protein
MRQLGVQWKEGGGGTSALNCQYVSPKFIKGEQDMYVYRIAFVFKTALNGSVWMEVKLQAFLASSSDGGEW